MLKYSLKNLTIEIVREIEQENKLTERKYNQNLKKNIQIGEKSSRLELI